jgi:hypothetical protein
MAKKTIPLPGKTSGWMSTGISLKEGQTAKIKATGEISFFLGGQWKFSPDGEMNQVADGNSPAPGLVKNSLVAKAGGAAAYIGSNGEITAESNAQLMIAANDNYSNDNDGYWTVVIEIS